MMSSTIKPTLFQNSPLNGRADLELAFFFNANAGTVITPNGPYCAVSDLNLISPFLQILDSRSQNLFASSIRFFITENSQMFTLLRHEMVGCCSIFSVPAFVKKTVKRTSVNPTVSSTKKKVNKIQDQIATPLEIADIIAKECLGSSVCCLFTQNNEVILKNQKKRIRISDYYAVPLPVLLLLEKHAFTMAKIMYAFLNRFRHIIRNGRNLNFTPVDVFDEFWAIPIQLLGF